ncbi:hypothetical protein AAIR98_001490 [Elusimicrobium simillimum]|uniref:hypothetical protein n=1 Tax=Elusimicrobium simillimum TaxID=3143438 RepID=UPI003C6F3E6B
MEAILLTIISLIVMLLPFIIKKVLAYFFPYLSSKKKLAPKSTVILNSAIKDNLAKISLLEELNFLKAFYTPA